MNITFTRFLKRQEKSLTFIACRAIIGIVQKPIIAERCCVYHIMNKQECQDSVCEVLCDTSKTGKKRHWDLHKINSTYIMHAYKEIDMAKSKRIEKCADWLQFKLNVDGSKSLHNANFCRVRLCPMCQWRRAIKCYSQMAQVLDLLRQDGYEFLFLTLTIKNVSGEALNGAITAILKAFGRLTKLKAFEPIQGYYRGCEVTHNLTNDTYHPHLHCILAVKPSYFNGRNYLSHAKWQELWRKCLRVSYDPSVDIRKCKGGAKAIAEACKYSVKPSDIICMDDWDVTVETLRLLDKALDKRRFIGLGGVIKEAHKRLHLDDMEDGDLVASSTEENVDINTVTYFWDGYSQYRS